MTNINLQPALECLEPRLLMSGTPSLSQIDVPSLGEVAMVGELSTAAYSQYTINPSASGVMNIDMKADASSIDSYLAVYNSSGRLMVANDNASAGTKDAHLRIVVGQGQTYYVRVRALRQTSGQYALTMKNTPLDDFGDTAATAGRMALNRLGVGIAAGAVNYSQDVDLLKVVATKTGSMTVTMAPRLLNGNLLSSLAVQNVDGSVLALGNAQGKNATLTFNVVAGRTYYLRPSGQSGTSDQYVLRASTKVAAVAPPATPPGTPAVADDAYAPAAAVTAQVVQTAAGLRLVVLGTDGSDTITLSQTDAGMVVTTTAGAQTYWGSFIGASVYGFGGDDTLRVTSTVTAAVLISAGSGNDSIFDAGAGSDSIVGGAGNTSIVSIGGGAHQITVGGTLTSLWYDANDTVINLSKVRSAAAHKVASFYQPYTSDPASSQYVPMEIAGQDLVDPTLTGNASAYKNFAGNPLFAGGPKFTDIRQGYLGDCYYLASLASIADNDPQVIRDMVTPLGDGTYAVRFYSAGKAVYLRLDADLPVVAAGGLAYAQASADGATWAAVLEKAYAYFRYGKNSYASIEGGWMSTVNEQITGLDSPYRWTSGTIAADFVKYLSDNLNAGHAVTAASAYRATGPIVANHAYMVKSVDVVGGMTYVTVYNPWGYDGRAYDSNSGDGALQLSLDVFMSQFVGAVVCMA